VGSKLQALNEAGGPSKRRRRHGKQTD